MLSGLFSRRKSAPPTTDERVSVIAAIDQGAYTVSEAAIHLPAAILVDKLNTYLEVVLNAISASGGRCLRHVGCAVIAEWPLPANESAQRAIGDGLIEIVRQTRTIKLTPTLRIRPIIGVAHGHVIHSTHQLSGSEVRLEMGQALTRANQLCSMCSGQKTEILFFKGLPVLWPEPLQTETLGPIVIAGIVETFELQTLKFPPDF